MLPMTVLLFPDSPKITSPKLLEVQTLSAVFDHVYQSPCRLTKSPSCYPVYPPSFHTSSISANLAAVPTSDTPVIPGLLSARAPLGADAWAIDKYMWFTCAHGPAGENKIDGYKVFFHNSPSLLWSFQYQWKLKCLAFASLRSQIQLSIYLVLVICIKDYLLIDYPNCTKIIF